MEKIKVGIFFGGPSREREISFAGGRTVYDNLNKSVFEPVPIFVDSFKSFIHLNWEYVYKGTIRDFYPPVSHLPETPHGFQVYAESLQLSDTEYHKMIATVGRKIELGDLAELIDVAFLALHGEYGEDGQIQSLLQSTGIPFTGSGVLPCAIGMDKGVQKKLMEQAGFACPKILSLQRKDLVDTNMKELYAQVREEIGTSFVIRPANQGSSIGVSILHDPSYEEFEENTLKAFFQQRVSKSDWQKKSLNAKVKMLKETSDFRDGLGFPIEMGNKTIYHPEALMAELDQMKEETVVLKGHHQEHTVIFESFIDGKEFSCIVIRNEDNSPVALPPTEIRKQGQLYDYKSKYLPGLSRKITPIDLPENQIESIRQECVKLYKFLSFNTYARIDGFITNDGAIYLNDPNTTSGMLPSSFFFHQAAEIGLDPSQFLNYILRTSLVERIDEALVHTPRYTALKDRLDHQLKQLQNPNSAKKKIAVILGGYSFERHISVESGRNIYEKLASSEKYLPIPIFLKGDANGHELYKIPINLLLKDNADDIRDKIAEYEVHPIIDRIKKECHEVTAKYRSSVSINNPIRLSYEELAQEVDAAFIALHGRPGEDGNVQQRLKAVGIPYNGSDTPSSEITINKYKTLQLLKEHGFTVASQYLINKVDFDINCEAAIRYVEALFSYPFIAKPVDDGCSSAVMVIKTRESFNEYLEAIFRTEEVLSEPSRKALGLAYNEEFPIKDQVLIESMITKGDADHFLEITGGLLTHRTPDGMRYEVFEPSEALAGGEILSLEEKFLAGEGQNLTPARFGADYESIAAQVKRDLERVARLLNVEGYARIDAFVRIYEDNKVETIIIEVNSLPGMTPATCIFHQCAINGYKPYDFIDRILQYALND